jgi:Domain of unknown function (DUF1906)
VELPPSRTLWLMDPIEGVDYSSARPSPAALFAAGKRFAVRYGGPGSSGKHLTLAEANALRAAGLSIVANAEGSSGGFTGRTAGVSWARSADTAFRACGMPADRPIYFSVDWNVTSAQWPGVVNALRGAADVIGAGRVGIYGSYNAVVWARRDGVAHWFWQTYAWSGGHWAGGNHLEQYRNGVIVAGGDCDLTRALTVDYGQWGQQRPAPVAPNGSTDGEDDMSINFPRFFSDAADPTSGPNRAIFFGTPGQTCTWANAAVASVRGLVTGKWIEPWWSELTPTAGGPGHSPDAAPGVHRSLIHILGPIPPGFEDCAAFPTPTITVPDNADEVIAGVLQGLADNPDSPATQADVDGVLAAIAANPAAVRQAFRDQPLT